MTVLLLWIACVFFTLLFADYKDIPWLLGLTVFIVYFYISMSSFDICMKDAEIEKIFESKGVRNEEEEVSKSFLCMMTGIFVAFLGIMVHLFIMFLFGYLTVKILTMSVLGAVTGGILSKLLLKHQDNGGSDV
jgi:hypothetical protein